MQRQDAPRVPQALFSPPSFLLREKRWGRRRRVRNDHDGTNPCRQGFLSSVLVSSFPNRKLNLRFGFHGKFPTTSQSRLRRASSPGRGAKGMRTAGGSHNLSVSCADSIPIPFVPSGHFPLIGEPICYHPKCNTSKKRKTIRTPKCKM